MVSVIFWIVVAAVVLLGLVGGGLALFTAWTARQVEKTLPPRGRFVDVDGARIHYLDEGSGPPIVLIHGLAGQVHNFTHSLLGRLRDAHRVIVVDRPGSGYSTAAPGSSAAVDAQARLIANFIVALGLERPLIVGHSLGGAIGLYLGLNHPEQVGGLALLAPVTTMPERIPAPFEGLAIQSPLLRRLVAWTLATPISIANRTVVLETLFGPQPVAADFAIKGGGLLNLRPKSFIGASRDLTANEQELKALPGRYQELKVPLGIIYGSQDRILDPAAHGKGLAAQRPDADFELIEGGGHMILITSADRCAAFIVRAAQRLATVQTKLAPVA
jgi:pimeloyl-ACP methyl ester carboxylesterase